MISSQPFLPLRCFSLNDRKSRIDQQAHFLSHLPKILPFHPLPPASSNVSHHTWEAWWLEHDRIEREADIFRADEFALMKKVAMCQSSKLISPVHLLHSFHHPLQELT